MHEWINVHPAIITMISIATALTGVAILVMMIPSDKHGEAFGACSSKIPPKWDNAWEKNYSYDMWEKDVLLWVRSTELKPENIAPAIVLNLGGEARNTAREMDYDILVQGRATGPPDPSTGFATVVLQP